MQRIGCARLTAFWLLFAELAIIVIISVLTAILLAIRINTADYLVLCTITLNLRVLTTGSWCSNDWIQKGFAYNHGNHCIRFTGLQPRTRKAKEPATPRVIDGKAKVFTTFYPTHYFARRIGGELTEVICPCPANEDPAFWMPDDKTILSYQGADLIVVNGASFEKWLNKVTLPESRIVDTTKPFAKEFITIAGAVTHSHGPSGEHTHAGIDGHTWLDPINAIAQSSAIRDALCKLLPETERRI